MPGVLLRTAAVLALVAGGASAQAAEVSLTGGLRGRYEALDGQFRPDLGGSDQMFSFRSNLAAELKLSNLTLGGEISDGRAYLADTGSAISSSDVNTLEPVQFYARYRTGAAEWTVGRFTQDLGSRRVISRSRSGNTTNAFTGLRGVWTGPDGSALTGLYVLPVIRRPTDQAAVLDNKPRVDTQSGDYRLYGAFYTSPAFGEGVQADLYAFRLTEEDEADRGTRNRRLNLVGARLFRNPGPGVLDFEIEAIAQGGQARASAGARDLHDLDVSAFALHAEAGWTFSGPLRPRLELAYDYGTGDSDPADDDYGRYDNFFGSRRGDFGPGGAYGPLSRSNVQAPVVRLELTRPKVWESYFNYRPLWLVDAHDAFGATGVQDPAGRSGRFAGHAFEARFRRFVTANLVWDSGAALLVPDGFLEVAPNAAGQGRTAYGYTDLTWTF
jgi:hypothetical protein